MEKDVDSEHSVESTGTPLRSDSACGAPAATAEPWPIRGIRVEDDTVIITVKGGNGAARWLCGELFALNDK